MSTNFPMNPILMFLWWGDRLLNCVFTGDYYQTLSARAYVSAAKGQPYWGWTERFIDGLFFWESNHCLKQWQREANNPIVDMDFWDGLKVILGGTAFLVLFLTLLKGLGILL